MERNQSLEVEEIIEASARDWQWLDDTMVLVGLLLFQASLLKSGYSADVMAELQDRLTKLIKQYARKGQ
jgi:hypothetical protein